MFNSKESYETDAWVRAWTENKDLRNIEKEQYIGVL